jgi:phage portal protein BeeE
MNALLRGDMKTRFGSYHNAINDGWMNRDEIRALEDMNPMPDGKVKIYYFNGNFKEVGTEDSNEPVNTAGGQNPGN